MLQFKSLITAKINLNRAAPKPEVVESSPPTDFWERLLQRKGRSKAENL